MGTGGGRGEALEGVRLGVVRSSHGDYAWYGSDTVQRCTGDLCGLTYTV